MSDEFVGTVLPRLGIVSVCVVCIASELHHLMMYYILPILIPYLPANHFHHLAVLITATRILLSHPTRDDVELAGIMLECFVKETPLLYGMMT